MLRHLTQSGDTIIEVLICIAVVSLALGGAFVTTRNSQLGVRDSQEHAEALQLLQSQIEQIRAADANGTDVFHSGTFCMYQNNLVATMNPYPADDCTQDGDGNATTSQPGYKLAVTATPAGLGANGYSLGLSVTWPEVVGDGNATEYLTYRIYQ